MQFNPTSRRIRPVRRVAAVALMLALWLATVLLGMSPALHRILHDDSHSPSHECVVTALDKGHFLAGAATVSVISAERPEGTQACPADFRIVPARDHRVAPGRAPPSRVSPFTVAG